MTTDPASAGIVATSSKIDNENRWMTVREDTTKSCEGIVGMVEKLTEVLDDIAVREPADPIISATIHRTNGASFNLFKRHGFDNIGSFYGDYLIVW